MPLSDKDIIRKKLFMCEDAIVLAQKEGQKLTHFLNFESAGGRVWKVDQCSQSSACNLTSLPFEKHQNNKTQALNRGLKAAGVLKLHTHKRYTHSNKLVTRLG